MCALVLKDKKKKPAQTPKTRSGRFAYSIIFSTGMDGKSSCTNACMYMWTC